MYNTKTFINKSIEKHGNKYDYSLVTYKNNKTKVKIICPKHGIFEQLPSNHLRYNCPECSKVRKMNTKSFIKKSNIAHNNKYDYSLVTYKNNKTKVKIICPKHGIFETRPDNHINKKSGCSKCANNQLYSKKEFIERCNKIHNNKYDYSIIDYKTAHIKIKIICPEHGIFNQMPYSHINGIGCPMCKTSKGEKEIIKILEKKKIKFHYQHNFNNCRYKNKLTFDFFLPNKNTIIEYDGIQHTESIKFFGGEEGFKYRKIRDEIKNKYCKNNKIKLIRINSKESIKKYLKNI